MPLIFNVNKDNGFNYQYFKYNQPGASNITTIIQGGELGAFMSYNNANITVSQNGASSSPLTIMTPNTTNPLTVKNSSNADLCVINSSGNMSLTGNMAVSGNLSCAGTTNFSGSGGFSYYYDVTVSGNRTLTDFSSGPEYINFSVTKSGSTRYLAMNQNLLRASPIELVTPDSTSPLICKNSANTVVCSITNTGGIIATGSITSNGKEVLTTAYNTVFCGGRVSLTGGNVPFVGTSTGRVSYTVTRKSLGVYWINYATPYPNNNYTPSVTNADRLYGCSIGNNTSSALLEVVTFVSSTVNGDSPFYFSVF